MKLNCKKKSEKDIAMFGCVNLETRTSHDGYIDENGKMAFKKEGTPISPESYEKIVQTRNPSDLPQPIKDEIITMSNWVTMPRWARFATFLRKTEMLNTEYGIKIDIQEDVGLIMVTTFFKITGRREVVQYLMNEIHRLVEAY